MKPSEKEPGVALALEKWRASRAPADAEAVESLGASDPVWKEQLAVIARTSGKLDAVVARMQSVSEVADDPRLTTAIVGWIHEARWAGSGAAAGWAAIFERLVTLRDGRAVAPLRQMAKELPPFLGAKHRAYIAGELTRVADALERDAPRAEAANAISIGATFDVLAVVGRVFEAPADDDVRRVVADELLEHGDPWGELIQLQLLVAEGAATSEQERAAAALIKKHGARFAGPLAKISRTDSRELRKGFLVRVLANAVMVPRPAWEAAASSPFWSTVTRLEVSVLAAPMWWLPALMKNPAARSLREVHFNRYDTPYLSLERASEAAPWRIVQVQDLGDIWLRFLRQFVQALPVAERDRIEIVPEEARSAILAVIAEARDQAAT